MGICDRNKPQLITYVCALNKSFFGTHACFLNKTRKVTIPELGSTLKPTI